MSDFRISGYCSEFAITIEEQIANILNAGAKYLCIDTINGKMLNEWSLETLKKEIYPFVKKSGVEIASLITKIGLHQIDDDNSFEEEKKLMTELADACEVLKIRYMSVYTPYIPKKNYDEKFEKVIQQMKAYQAIAQKRGITLTLLHHADTYASRADRVMQVVVGVAANNFKIAFNSESYMRTNEVPMAAYRYLKSKVDFFYLQDLSNLMVTVPIGMGDVKIYELLRMASRENFNGYVCLKSEMTQYLNRGKIYSWGVIPFVALISRRYRTFKRIDRVIKHDKNNKNNVDSAYLFKLQMRLLRKIVNKVLNKN